MIGPVEEPEMTGAVRHVAGPRQPPPPPPIDWAFEEPQTAAPVVLPVEQVGEKRPAEDVEDFAADEPAPKQTMPEDEPPPMQPPPEDESMQPMPALEPEPMEEEAPEPVAPVGPPPNSSRGGH